MIDKKNIIASLSEIYNDKDGEDYELMVEKLNNITINRLINYILNGIDEYSSDDKIIIELIIKILQVIFHNSEIDSPVNDEDYEKLYALYKELRTINIIGTPINKVKDRKIGYHSYPSLRGTLDKVHFIKKLDKGKDIRKSLEEWIKGVETKLGRPLHSHEKKAIMTPKWDGLSTIFEFKNDSKIPYKVLTRGDVENNEALDITELFKEIDIFFDIEGSNTNINLFENTSESIILDTDYAIKTEVVMTFPDFKRFCDEVKILKQPRGAVTSILNKTKNFNKEHLKYLTVIGLQCQKINDKFSTTLLSLKHGFSMIHDITDLDEIQFYINKMVDNVNKAKIPIDGVVITLTDKNVKEKLGRDNNINNFEVAYKLPAEQKKTKLKNILFSTGILGSITPVALIEPVKIKGNTINNISLGSMDRFEDLQSRLRKGSEVLIKYDVIPYLCVDDNCDIGNGELIVSPTECMYCHKKLVKQPVLKCINVNCESRQIGKIINYVKKMSIPNISEGIITSLYTLDVLKNIKDLYFIEQHAKEILLFKGFGKTILNKIISSINSRKHIHSYELLGSLGIPDIGRRIFKKILNIYYLNELKEICLNNDLNKLINIRGVKNKTALKIIEGINNNIELINFLCSELEVKEAVAMNYTLCFTKVRDKEFEKYLDTINVSVVDTYNKGVDMIVIKDNNIHSTKIDKARRDFAKFGKPVIVTLENAYELFKYKK